MIKRILIAEDHESANVSVQKTVEALQISQADHAFYCDDALAKIKLALQKNDPYDLLITDLWFEKDEKIQKIADGMQLIAAAREIQPALKIIVFSADNLAATIETLHNKLEVDGYVRKARNDAKELILAIESVSKNQRHFPKQAHQRKTHDFTEYDITVITLLAKGIHQKDIPTYLRENDIPPFSLSSLEKRLNHIKDLFDFSKNEQLVAFCKDMGII
ncbi:response regulator [Chitinophaga parva]|uniref:Response regulator n=1 Tax=Chitinophaga parva TaxID=2169414 RepID=A0A2T7BNV8_9BACT|nr:response regulator [Chitinophaga parva]PUZ29363.1 response regulator [Chitinophaga parva]